MTIANTVGKTPPQPGGYRLPDPPERHPDDMTSSRRLSATGNQHHLAQHLGSPDTTIVAGERYVVVRPARSMAGSHYPDLLVAFDAAPAAYEASNGYVIEEQGKPPDFVMEIASRHTGHIDVGEKRDDYAALGILEYWRFDETGQFHGARLAGDQLVNGVYVPILIEELPDGSMQGYSPVLNLNIRWENGQLAWHDPDTGRHILTYEDQRERADAAESRAENAEARVLELEAELHRLRGG